jgi:hypothetical protein
MFNAEANGRAGGRVAILEIRWRLHHRAVGECRAVSERFDTCASSR